MKTRKRASETLVILNKHNDLRLVFEFPEATNFLTYGHVQMRVRHARVPSMRMQDLTTALAMDLMWNMLPVLGQTIKIRFFEDPDEDWQVAIVVKVNSDTFVAAVFCDPTKTKYPQFEERFFWGAAAGKGVRWDNV